MHCTTKIKKILLNNCVVIQDSAVDLIFYEFEWQKEHTWKVLECKTLKTVQFPNYCKFCRLPIQRKACHLKSLLYDQTRKTHCSLPD